MQDQNSKKLADIKAAMAAEAAAGEATGTPPEHARANPEGAATGQPEAQTDGQPDAAPARRGLPGTWLLAKSARFGKKAKARASSLGHLQDGLPGMRLPDKSSWLGKKAKALTSGSARQRFERFFFESSIDPIELEFMSEADAAIYRHGRPRTYVISLAVMLFFIAAVIWAASTRLDEVTKAQGQVVPAQAIQEIQYLEGGVLEALTVRQGDDVVEGQVVARISNVLAQSTLQEQKDGQAALTAEVTRLRAERDGVAPVFDEELSKEYPNIVRGEMDLYTSRLAQRRTELRSLEAELEQRRREVQEHEARLKSLQTNLGIAVQRRDLAKPLVDKGTYSRMDFMNLEQSLASLEGDFATSTQSVSRAKSAVTAAEEKINSRKLEWQSGIQEELNKKSAALSSVTTLLAARGDTVKRTDLRSPVKGKVKRVLLNTVGGSVPPGGTIMEILPIDDKLLIEARVSPADRAFLHTSEDPTKKQKAIIKISSYDFTIYGGLDATLESISDDTFEDNRGDIYYEIRLLTTSNAIMHNGQAYEILPGMTAQVDIITGKKTVLSYLLKPILRAKQNALRER